MPVYVQSILTPDPVYLQTKSYSAQSVRKWFADINPPGVVGSTSFLVTLTTGMGISIAGGIAWILGQNVADQGMYRQYVLGSTALTVTAAHASLPRLDQVILRVMDNTHDGSSFNECRLEIVPGTATSGATLANRSGATNLAALGESSKSVLLLADILVPAAASSLVGGNLADKRIQSPPVIPAAPATPAVHVFHTVAQSITNGTITALAFNSARFDTDTITSVANRLTCKTAGKYMITGSAEFDANGVGDRYLEILLNGATIIAATGWVHFAVNGGVLCLPVSTLYQLAVNDYVQLRVNQTSGNPLNVNAGNSQFTMVKVG